MKPADIVPSIWEGEPHRIGAGLKGHLPKDLDGGVKGDGFSQGDFHFRQIQKEPLDENLAAIWWPKVVDSNRSVCFGHRPSG